MVSLIELREKLAKVSWLGLPMLILWTSSPISQQDEELGFAIFGGLMVCMVVMLIISILIAVWVYRDAKSRGMSGALWLIIVLLFGIIGLIIYLVVRHDKVPEGYYPPPGQYPPPQQYQQPYQQPQQPYQQPQQPYQQPPEQPPPDQQQPPPPQGQAYDPETGQYK